MYFSGSTFDLLTLDTETTELNVLKSNDWSKWCPYLIVMESIVSFDKPILSVMDDPAVFFLMDKGYDVIAKAGNAVYLKYNI